MLNQFIACGWAVSLAITIANTSTLVLHTFVEERLALSIYSMLHCDMQRMSHCTNKDGVCPLCLS